MSADHNEIQMGDGNAARDSQIRAILDDRKRRRDSGEATSDVSLIAANPDLMPELGEELRKLRIIAAARQKALVPPPEPQI